MSLLYYFSFRLPVYLSVKYSEKLSANIEKVMEQRPKP